MTEDVSSFAPRVTEYKIETIPGMAKKWLINVHWAGQDAPKVGQDILIRHVKYDPQSRTFTLDLEEFATTAPGQATQTDTLLDRQAGLDSYKEKVEQELRDREARRGGCGCANPACPGPWSIKHIE